MPKKTDSEDRLRQILKVAHLFYEQDLTKTEISHEIRASATQVARLLDEAREQGFVRIEFSPPKLYDLAERLRRKYTWLQAVTVVPYAEDLVFLRRLLGKAAAEYFATAVTDHAVVALGGGDTMYEMVMALPAVTRDVRLVPAAIIDSGPILTHIDPAVLVTLLWVRCGRQAGQAHLATGLPFNRPLSRQKLKEEYEEFSRRKAVQEVLAEMKRADFLFTSLGCLEPAAQYASLAARPHELLLDNVRLTKAGLLREGVVGDFNYSFFDASGETQANWNIFPALDVAAAKQLVREQKQVVVAVGHYKIAALLAALCGRLLNVLITDERAAAELLATSES